MKIKVVNEGWFKSAKWFEVEMLGIKYLDIPAARLEGKQPEAFKRALVRQVYIKKFKYGDEFEIIDNSNPFGSVKKTRRTATDTTLTGGYKYVRCGLRAPDGDIRYELFEVFKKHHTFEDCIAEVDEKYGKGHKFNSTGALIFDVRSFLDWSLKRGWLIKC